MILVPLHHCHHVYRRKCRQMRLMQSQYPKKNPDSASTNEVTNSFLKTLAAHSSPPILYILSCLDRHGRTNTFAGRSPLCSIIIIRVHQVSSQTPFKIFKQHIINSFDSTALVFLIFSPHINTKSRTFQQKNTKYYETHSTETPDQLVDMTSIKHLFFSILQAIMFPIRRRHFFSSS